ncbi:DUF2865 domain-containing protein [Methylocystis sp. 9N]|uniref:DUF2865 domain-containing protein n=1 Tax=Methylocystis borbori TaxID=3118750 RepID=A0ABU7XG83_9HYPH
MRLIRRHQAVIAGALAFGLALAPRAVPAQESLFDFLFGPGPSAPRAPSSQGPRDGSNGAPAAPRPEGGSGAYCVRACDGYYFPLVRSSQATRQQSCEFLCPSASVEAYEGGGIEYARNAKGQRYSALPTAFKFREKVTKDCSCNDPATSQAHFLRLSLTDPTLRSGDVVVEPNGPFVYNGEKLVALSRSALPAPVKAHLRELLRRKNAPDEESALTSDDALALSKPDGQAAPEGAR